MSIPRTESHAIHYSEPFIHLIARLDKYTYLSVNILQLEDNILYLQCSVDLYNRFNGLRHRIDWTFFRIRWACPYVIFKHGLGQPLVVQGLYQL